MAAQLLPKLRIKSGEGIGNELFFQFPDLRGEERSYLDADSAIGATTLTASGTNLAINDYIVVGQPGQEKTEIIQVTSVSATTIGVGAGMVFAHNRGEVVIYIPYNQIEPQRQAGGSGAFSALSIINLRPDASETYLARTSDASNDVYKFRFYNATTVLYSAYSDTETATGYAFNTFGALKRRAFNDISEDSNNPLFNDEFLVTALQEGRRELDQDQRVAFKWSFRTKFNVVLGSIIPGRYSMTAPTDLRGPNTPSNVLAIRIGNQNRQIIYQDWNRFNQNYLNIRHSTLNGAITVGSTSIILTNSGDFDVSGSITVAGESVTDVNDSVAYTGNTLSTQTLTGVTGIGAAGHASGRDVWQNSNFGTPGAWSINNGTIYFDVPFADSLAGQLVYIDYFNIMTEITNDNSVLDEPEVDMLCSYLKWKMKYKRSNGVLKFSDDGDWNEWDHRKNEFINKEITGQYLSFIPSYYEGMRQL